MTTTVDSCPRCGYVLLQPAPPVDQPAPPPPPVLSYAVPYRNAAPPAPPAAAASPGAASGLSAASVPKLLLGLGAVCLLVAAVIFLAVAWSWLGVGGRTAVLLGPTAASAAAGQWLSRRDLTVAAEALTTVALGLVVVDLVGARSAGWLDVATDQRFLVVVGAGLLVVSSALCLPRAALSAPQVVAPLGLGLVELGLGVGTTHLSVLTTTCVLLFTGLAVLAHRRGLVVLPWTGATGALLSLSALTAVGLGEAADHPTLRGLWLEGHGTGLLLVAALVLLPWAVVRGNDDLRQLVCAVSVSLLTFAAALPVLDEDATSVTLAAAGASVVWALLAAAAPPRWYAVPRVPLAGSLLVLVPLPAYLAVHSVVNLFAVADPFTAGWRVRLHPEVHVASPLLLPVAVAVVLLAWALTVPRPPVARYQLAGVVGLTVVLTAAEYPLPLALFVAALGPFGIVLAPPSAVLTLLVLGEIVLVAAYVMHRRNDGVAVVAGLVLPLAAAAFLWTGGHLLDLRVDRTSLLVLVALGLLAVAVPRPELELVSAVAAASGALVSIPLAPDMSVSLAVHLTAAGALVTASALVHRDHRALSWLGGLLLAGATWVRLYDVGVHAPEAYTLPTALALVAVGLHRLHRSPELDTTTALLPGLALALAPTLLWALVDPLSTRAVLAGLAALGLVLAGSVLRWSAPVVVGWSAGLALVLRELAPYAAQTPQWALIGGAGALLITAGISWETQVRELRRAAGYLGRLR